MSEELIITNKTQQEIYETIWQYFIGDVDCNKYDYMDEIPERTMKIGSQIIHSEYYEWGNLPIDEVITLDFKTEIDNKFFNLNLPKEKCEECGCMEGDYLPYDQSGDGKVLCDRCGKNDDDTCCFYH